ncbi:ATP-binding protein [Streptomyces shenzhenensis]|uniref:Transcriptional regulator n=1 Tax=Streptomyces shenzhenensis TaxID=943815 RepID=A0A3M0I479_9ACTN|nr:ATP-binding protein [Streptomyces shenzhenensis]RMB83635.1 transcriptional regulator [Streptomyces shenzhenensis]
MIKQRRAAMSVCFAPVDGPPPVLLLVGEATSASIARKFVREHFQYELPDASAEYIDAVELVTCELVTNAIRYGTTPGHLLRVEIGVQDTRTRVEVEDPVRRRPQPGPESHENEGGRGLIILDALCADWGVTDAQSGKKVWAEVTAP